MKKLDVDVDDISKRLFDTNEVTKLAVCDACRSRYNPNNAKRKLRHESKQCISKKQKVQ